MYLVGICHNCLRACLYYKSGVGFPVWAVSQYDVPTTFIADYTVWVLLKALLWPLIMYPFVLKSIINVILNLCYPRSLIFLIFNILNHRHPQYLISSIFVKLISSMFDILNLLISSIIDIFNYWHPKSLASLFFDIINLWYFNVLRSQSFTSSFFDIQNLRPQLFSTFSVCYTSIVIFLIVHILKFWYP